jgi:hypothetical protein
VRVEVDTVTEHIIIYSLMGWFAFSLLFGFLFVIAYWRSPEKSDTSFASHEEVTPPEHELEQVFLEGEISAEKFFRRLDRMASNSERTN